MAIENPGGALMEMAQNVGKLTGEVTTMGDIIREVKEDQHRLSEGQQHLNAQFEEFMQTVAAQHTETVRQIGDLKTAIAVVDARTPSKGRDKPSVGGEDSGKVLSTLLGFTKTWGPWVIVAGGAIYGFVASALAKGGGTP